MGDELPHLVKGPLTVRDMIAWDMGAGSPMMKGHKLAMSWARRHPGGAQHAGAGDADVPELVHLDDSYTQDIGIPGAYDHFGILCKQPLEFSFVVYFVQLINHFSDYFSSQSFQVLNGFLH